MGVERGMRLTTSNGAGASQTFWVVGRKSATELLVAASWRDSLWVLWFQLVGWLWGRWHALRSRFRRDETFEDDDGDSPLFVPPADDSEREIDPKMLN